ncbi:KRAB-A domain-containing protein 2-like [Metopolophium dirhodum]|uniref:KRAB-A domain-containing protein 2-like n=1 Tax=Metopolophium dirhodum TaxID=44670 RepID=UPI0029907E64|nr:KRAB-A domain-containing protein 2-like [Metopolophium dirhodum]
MKTKFDTIIKNTTTERNNSTFLLKEKYDSLISEVKRIKTGKKESPRDYWLVQRYDVIEVQGNEKLIRPMKENSDIIFYVHDEELYDILLNIHLSIGHGGRDRMMYELKKKYKNITQSNVKIFLNLCESCVKKQKSEKKGIVTNPMIFSELNSRCQLDLIDYQSQADGEYKFVLVYQDHLTKFCILKPLKSERAEEVAYCLIDIFTVFGAPSVLQSDNGREFRNQTIDSLKEMWPELSIIHGKPRHSQSQGSVERANQDIENMIITWMKDNNTTKWSEGLRFIQFMKNKAFHRGIGRSPYEAMFGCSPKVGISSNTPDNILKVLNTDKRNTEEELCQLCINKENISNKREEAKECLERQAKRMKLQSDMSHPPALQGCNVRVKIPDVDRSKCDPQSIIAIVLEKTTDGFYRLGTKYGILKQLYARSQFSLCTEKFITLSDVPDVDICLRKASESQSLGNGQGFFKCTCQQKCTTKRCICLKNNLLCNSKCHPKSSCTNK